MHNKQFLAVLGLVLILTSGTAWAKEIKVPGDFPTITQAINNASTGDVIKVAEGTYTENLTITATLTLTENLTLEGAGAEKTIIDGAAQSVPTIVIQSIKNVTVRGFTIQNGTRRGIDIINRSTGIVIENNIVRNNRNLGLSAINQSEVKIFKNQIVDTVKATAVASGRGLQVVDSQAVISGNTIAKNAEIGIAIFSSKVEINDNQINENGAEGIILTPSATTIATGTITGNTLNGNRAAGIVVTQSNVEISKNKIANTQKPAGTTSSSVNGAGIVVRQDARAKLSENMITGSAGDGVAVFGAQAELTSNTIKDNQGCGVNGDRSAMIAGNNNEISGNMGGDLCGSAPASIKK